MSHVSSRLAALVVTLVLLSHTVAIGGTTYFCRIDGQTRSSCCCETQRDGQQPTCVRPQGSFCCDVRINASSQPPAKLEESSASIGNANAAALPALPVADFFTSIRSTHLAFETPSPPNRNRTIQVLVCSFLI